MKKIILDGHYHQFSYLVMQSHGHQYGYICMQHPLSPTALHQVQQTYPFVTQHRAWRWHQWLSTHIKWGQPVYLVGFCDFHLGVPRDLIMSPMYFTHRMLKIVSMCHQITHVMNTTLMKEDEEHV